MVLTFCGMSVSLPEDRCLSWDLKNGQKVTWMKKRTEISGRSRNLLKEPDQSQKAGAQKVGAGDMAKGYAGEVDK